MSPIFGVQSLRPGDGETALAWGLFEECAKFCARHFFMCACTPCARLAILHSRSGSATFCVALPCAPLCARYCAPKCAASRFPNRGKRTHTALHGTASPSFLHPQRRLCILRPPAFPSLTCSRGSMNTEKLGEVIADGGRILAEQVIDQGALVRRRQDG
jgi:hypothetical protein